MSAAKFARFDWLVPGLASAVLVPVALVSLGVTAGGAAASVADQGGGRPLRAGTAAAGVISAVVGGVGGPAEGTRVILGGACGVSYARGAVYIADDSMVRQVSPPTGWLSTPAGTGPTFERPLGDGGPAASASLDNACGATKDGSGNIVIADTGDNRLRVVAKRTGRLFGRAVTAGHIYTVAGTGRAGFSGDGGRARNAELASPAGVTVSGAGNLLIADSGNNRIRAMAKRSGIFFGRMMPAGHIYTVAGDGRAGFSGDGGRAARAEVNGPRAVAVDRFGNLVIADTGNNRIRVVAKRTGRLFGRVMTAGHIYTVVGDGRAGFSGDGGRAARAELNGPGGVTADRFGNLVIADTGNNRIRVVAKRTGRLFGRAMTAGHIYTVAGDGTAGFSGNRRPAVSAQLNGPHAVAVDGSGNLVIADSGNNRIRVVAATTGMSYGRAMTARDIYTVAGTADPWYSGEGGLATAAEFIQNGQYPGIGGAALDGAGNLVLASSSANRVLVVPGSTGTFYGRLMTAGHIYSIAGDGTYGFAGDGGPATRATLAYPWGVAVDGFGNVLIAADQNNRIRMVAERSGTFYGQVMTAGDIYTVAGDGGCGFSGDGGPAAAAPVCIPVGVAVDNNGNVLVTDTGNGAIRVVPNKSGTYYGQSMTAGNIYTIVGDGDNGSSGDGGPATSAQLFFPQTARADAAGNVVIADTFNHRVRVVAAANGTFYGQAMTAGNIYTVAGTGTAGFSGEGGPASAAELSYPGAVSADGAGNLVIADTHNSRIRIVAGKTGTFYGQAMTAGDIYTVVGDGVAGCGGNGGPAAAAQLGFPQDVIVNSSGDLLTADWSCREIRQVTG